ncbi:unnamed protein product [Calypogeia fissa]
MGHSYQLLQQSSPRQRLLHDSPQHKQSNVYQITVSYQPADHDHQYIQHNQRGQQRNHGPLQPIPQQYFHQNSRNAPPHNSSYLGVHQPIAPPMQHRFNSQQENLSHYARPETQLLRLKVPMCCEACAERVVGSLSALRGVHNVDCDIRKEKVTVTGSAAAADILKACKKLFKKSEMWIDRYY